MIPRNPWLAAVLASFLLPASALAAAKTEAAPAKPDSDKPWKVEDAHGPYKDVAFETDEGTWLALDVHPDGKRIVFSLLGDLYLLPIEGGTATRITEGTAYDVQPRFSPDGKWIAFASDRGGLENLWVADLEGKNARQVSTEKESTVSGPAWSSDGSYLIGRKRITDASSLGTVELWMWHVRGGNGIRVTKSDEQPDAADPVFSGDGRFIYFSARGSRYQYNRNVNEGIWQIKRYDRRTGQSLPITGEFGGAATPTLSPDGKTMAYVRRVRAKTRIEAMDLASGKVRVIAEGVERDNQEGFAFHGVFPGFAWMPDGKHIVATADGKIHRWDVVTGARTSVPFRASVSQRVTDALRFPNKLGSDKVRARILRWPVESPDGKRLVFSAMGHLYAMDLPSGKASRLTTTEDLEYAPAFSEDGRKLTWVTWNDVEGGNVWAADVTGSSLGTPKRLTEASGQYANPSFSKDASKVVYVKGSGVTFRDQDLGDELWEEIHWVAATGGPSSFVIGTQNRGSNRRVTRPRFNPEGDRIVYLEDGPQEKPTLPPKSVLASVKLDGTDRRVLLSFQRAEEAVISPDGKWVVFSEAHNAFVTALPQIGADPTEASTEGGALPVTKLTDEGGEWVNWADGGTTMTWIFGPVYHRLAFDKAFPPPGTAEARKEEAEKAKEREKDKKKSKDDEKDAKKEEKKALPKSDAIEIVLEMPRAKPSGTVVYQGARIVTMKGDEVIENGTIVVENDRITIVGPTAAVTVPTGSKTVDLAGRTIIPGLFDEHAHLHYTTLDIFPQRPWKYLANLAYGVTSTHDPSASTHEVFGQSEMVEAGLMTGPRIFSTGFILYGADIPGRALVNSLDDARHHLRRMKAVGAFSVKSYMQPRREQRQWIIQAAREEGIAVVPEGGGDLEMDMTMVLDGHTTIEHALPIAPLRKDIVNLFGRSRTSYTPTLLVAYGGFSGDQWFFQHYDVWKDERLLKYVPQGNVDPRARIRSVMADDEDWHHIDVAASAKKVMEAGGTVCLGGHGQLQGLGPHWEMWAFVQGGMTPLQAIRVATINGAKTLGLEADLGSIESGKLADFVVLEKNPLEKIENSDSVQLVVKNGRAYTPQELQRATTTRGVSEPPSPPK